MVSVASLDGNGNPVITTSLAYSTILTNWNVVDWNGSEVANGGSGFFFTPTNPGVGTNVFYYTYSNSTPCIPGLIRFRFPTRLRWSRWRSLAPAKRGPGSKSPTARRARGRFWCRQIPPTAKTRWRFTPRPPQNVRSSESAAVLVSERGDGGKHQSRHRRPGSL